MSVFSVWFILHHVLQYNHGMLQLHDCASDDLFAFAIISLTRASNSFLIPTMRRFAANRSSSELNLTGAKVYILFSPFSLFISRQKARLIILLTSTKWSDSFSPALIQASLAFSIALKNCDNRYNQAADTNYVRSSILYLAHFLPHPQNAQIMTIYLRSSFILFIFV